MYTPVSPSFLKQEAKKLKRLNGISISKAYDEVVKKFGYSNYQHYLNVSNSKLSDLKLQAIPAQKRHKPIMPSTLTSGTREMFGDIYELGTLPADTAYPALINIIKNDFGTFRRETAANVLFNNFLISPNIVNELLQFVPVDYHFMLNPYFPKSE